MATEYERYYARGTVRAHEKAFAHFVTMEQAVRRILMQLKPATWGESHHEEIQMVLRTYRLKAEQELPDFFSGGGRQPGGGPAVPTSPARSKTPATQPGAAAAVDHRGTESFKSLGDLITAYGRVRTRGQHAICCAYNYSACASKTTTANGITYCVGGDGVRRLHICIRCNGNHTPEGAGKCSNAHIR